ncbi:MAG: aspartate aminotransferase family protein [Acidimicrobiia bacterium]
MATETDQERTQRLAHRHLWGHFSTLHSGSDVPVIVRGDGCWVEDDHGNRYLDGLAGLFVSQVGHGRTEIAEAAATQAASLGFFPIWTYAHPNAVELAARIAALAPGDLNRVFFTTGGSEAVESAWKLAKQYFAAIGQPGRHKVIARDLAYHGSTMGALAITGLDYIKSGFAPLTPGTRHARNTNAYHSDLDPTELAAECADDIERIIVEEGPETVAAVFLEPVQNSGGCFTPPPGYFERVRSICDRHGVLIVSDEVICGYGRIGHWFGCDRYAYLPDIVTQAKGITSGYAPLGACVVSDRVAEPFVDTGESFLHGITYAGHPVSCAVALANFDVMESEDLPGRVLRYEDMFRDELRSLLDLPIVGDVRGAGYFWGIELVKDKATRESFDDAECDHLLRDFLSPRLFELGLICRADDRGDPVVQLSPPLVAGPAEFTFIREVLEKALGEAWEMMSR